jgi:type I restriction enzyme S subunit
MATPNIRFQGFTDDWEQRKFSDVVEIGSGMDYKHLGEGDIPVYGTGGYMLSVDAALSEDKDAIGIGRKGTIDKPYILRAPFWTVDTLFYCIPKDGYDLDFTSCLFQNVDWKKKDESTGVPSLSKVIINNVETATPSYEEQRKIGDYFKGIDNLITLHQRKCDESKELKKFMLQKMFPQNGAKIPEIRFGGFTDDWEQRKLGDLVSFSKGSGYSKGDLKEDGTPIILYGRLYTKYETVISDVDTFVDEKKGSVYSKGGEVIVPASGETAEDISIASVVEKSGILLGGDLNVITPPDDLDSAFLAISISNGKPHNDMAKMAQGKSVVHLHNSDLAKIELPYPCMEEQRRISGFFSDIDNLITLHQRKCDLLKEVKQFMLENMFPKKG